MFSLVGRNLKSHRYFIIIRWQRFFVHKNLRISKQIQYINTKAICDFGKFIDFQFSFTIFYFTYNSYINNQTNRENFLKMQVKNANIDKLAAIPNGSRVKVFFTIEGRFYDKEDGTKGHAQNLSAFNFEVIKMAENKPATPAAPAPQETDF